MYETHGNLQRQVLCRFPAVTQMKPNCAWLSAPGGIWRVGTVNGNVWKQIEAAWAHDSYGNWTGSPPTLIQPTQITPSDEDGVELPKVRQGLDWVYRCATAKQFSLLWRKQDVIRAGGVVSGTGAVATIYSASTGLVVAQVSSPVLPWRPTVLANGSYAIHINYTDIVEGLRIPPGAVLNPDYNYVTDDGRDSHYNPDQNWGEVPADPEHPLRLLRLQLIRDNLTHDREDWAIYLTSEEPRDGEGAMIKLQVGPGNWTIAANKFVSPARALHRLDFTQPHPGDGSPSTAVPIAFDPMAAQISWVMKTRAGRILLGGSRMDGDGTHPAVWEWHENTTSATPLAMTKDSCSPICEQMLSTGGVTGMVELADGTIIVLTLCSRHRLAENDPSPENRLPRYPIMLDGEPGGRSLVSVGNRVHHMTESFGKQPDPESASFYSVGVDILGERLLYFPGTVAHVDSSLWNYRGKAYGIRADKAPTEDDAKLFITYYDGSWNKEAKPWRADWIYINRGISVNGRNLCFGFQPGSEDGLTIVNDGLRERVVDFDYRVRALFITEGQQVGYQQVVTPARKVIDAETLDDGWTLIALNGYTDAEDNPTDPPDPPSNGSGSEGSDSSSAIYYRVLEVEGAEGNPIYVVHLKDCSEGNVLTAVNKADGYGRVRLRVDSDAPVDDLESYIYLAPLGRAVVLPIPAYQRVEAVIFWEREAAELDLPLIGKRA